MTSSYSPQSSPGPAAARGPVAGGRVGLSEYTAQRLAELRARRAADAEAEAGSSMLPVTKAASISSPRPTSSSTISPPSQPPPPPPPSSTVAADSVSRFASLAEAGPRPTSSDRRLGTPPSPPSSSTTEPATDVGTRTPNGARRPAAAAPTTTSPQSVQTSSRPLQADVVRPTPSEANSSPVARQYHNDNYSSAQSTTMTSQSALNGITSGNLVAGRSAAISGSAPSGSASAYQQQHQLMTSSGYGSGSSSNNSPSTGRRPLPGNCRLAADVSDLSLLLFLLLFMFLF